MSQLKPEIQVLDKGLNLQTAKLLAPPGSVLDSLNYEQVDFQGQKRIDGYTRYDGRQTAALDELYILPVNNGKFVDNGHADLVFSVDTGKYIGVKIYEDFVPENIKDLLTEEEELVAVFNMAAAVAAGSVRLRTRVEDNKGSFDSPADAHKTALLMAGAWLRTRNTSLPGTVSGLHWFRDKLYAVSDLYVVVVTDISSLYANNILRDSSGRTTVVLDVMYAGGNTSYVLLDGTTKHVWTADDEGEELEVLSQDMSPVDSCTLYDVDPEFPEHVYQSSLHSANYEDYVDSDISGWSFINQGWILPFVSGKSSFGSFPSVNQNLKGVGIQGPTDITGDHGSPEAATQGNRIVGVHAQVSGWKSSNIPDSYTLVPDNIKRQDTLNIYADAYVSWADGVITSPSHNDDLVQYPATATVEVDL